MIQGTLNTNNSILVLEKQMIIDKGILYASVYSQLLYLNDYYSAKGLIDSKGYFKYKITFLAEIFKIDQVKLTNIAFQLMIDQIALFSFSVNSDEVYIKIRQK